MFKKILFFILIFIFSGAALQAQFLFTGKDPALEGSTQKYVISFTGTVPAGLSLGFQVFNGTIISQQVNPYTNNTVSVIVQWNCFVTQGTIRLRNGGVTVLYQKNVVIQSYANYPGLCYEASLPEQSVLYGVAPQPLIIMNCEQGCGYNITYQWEWGDVNTATPNADPPAWTNVTGNASATSDVLFPDAMYVYGIKAYHRITTIRNTSGVIIRTVISQKSTVIFLTQFDPGSISSPQTVLGYNDVPYITEAPATGGLCPANSYAYTWERSLEGSPWEVIGTGETYPATAPGIQGQTSIRRKVICAGLELVSNVLTFSLNYVSANTENLNYTRENTLLVPKIYSWAQADNLPAGDKIQVTTYYDGLGRSIQAVSKGTSYKFVEPTPGNPNPVQPNPLLADSYQDMASFTEYDALGRTPKAYLPYATNSFPGKYKQDAANAQPILLRSKFGEPSTAPTYSLTTYDNSPLNRVINVKAAGAGWGGDAAYKGNAADYDLVPAAENIRVWKIDYTTTALPVSGGGDVYADGKLMKHISYDEKEKRVVTYQDMNGNIILKKVQKEDVGPLLDEAGYTGWLCTYYVYDDFNQLRFTIPPKAVNYLLLHNWVMVQSIADDLCFYYQYDAKGRVIVKHTPHTGEMHLIYDNRDRLVLSQSAVQRSRPGNPPQWSFFLYDEQNRPVADGVVNNSDSRAIWQAEVDIRVNNNVQTMSIALNLGATETITAHSPFADAAHLYCNNCSSPVYNTVTYYDDYSYPGAKSLSSAYAFAATTNPYVRPMAQSVRLLDKVTGSKTRVLTPGNYTDNSAANIQYIPTTIYYDERGIIVQALSDNIKGGTDVVSSQYDYAGKVLSNCNTHTASNTSYTNYKVITAYQYDLLGRVLQISKGYNTATVLKTIASSTYDDMGQVVNKKIGKKPGAPDPLETLTYSYNINGMLTGINKDYALTPIDVKQWDNYFGQYFAYNNGDGGFHKEWNGSIAGTIWKTQGDNTPRQYEYTYDNAGRLTNAIFKQKDKPTATVWAANKVNFSVSMAYDDNGNITNLQQYGIIPGTPTPVLVDNLSYQYSHPETIGATTYQWSNLLLKVQDAVGAQAHNGKLGDFKSNSAATTDYIYDADGSLIDDANKGLLQTGSHGVVYNYFGKPQLIYNSTQKINVEYTYDAGGNKLAKKTTDYHVASNTVVSTTYYIGEFVYTDNTLDYILHEEGRLRLVQQQTNTQLVINGGDNLVAMPDGRQGSFDYFIKDNQGSTRMVLTEEQHMQKDICTMEAANGPVETLNFSSGANEVNATRVFTNNVWPSHYAPGSNESASKLSNVAGSSHIGPNIIYKVMAGDMVHAQVDYFYQGTAGAYSSSQQYLSNVATAISSSLFGSSHVPGGNVKDNNSAIGGLLGVPSGTLSQFLSSNSPTTSSTPRAYLNYLFFDEQFNFVADGSSAKPVGEASDAQIIATGLRVPKNGYVYVFLSNESDLPVYFDNFMVTHQRGAITEETHYYPQGLKAAGICAKAYGKPVNKYNYQAEYSEEETEAGWNDFDLRSYDQQIGRWVQSDPYDEFASPYIGMGGDPVNNIDPDGGSIFEGIGLAGRTFIGAFAGAIAGIGIAQLTSNEEEQGKWAAYGAFLGGAATYAFSSPLYVNVQFVPTWNQVRKDIKSHNGKFRSAYFAAKIRSIFNEIFSFGKIVTITGDGFVSGEKYRDENNQVQTSKGTLTSNLVKYFKRHSLAKGVANALTEFHSGYMGFCSNSGPGQFSGLCQYFNSNSTFMYGNCFQQSEADNTSNMLNGATVIGSYTQQLDLPYLLAGRLSGNPELANQNIVSAPNMPLNNNFMMHRVSQNGKTVYNGRLETKIKHSGRISYRKLSDTSAQKLNDRYYKIKSNILKNILSILTYGN